LAILAAEVLDAKIIPDVLDWLCIVSKFSTFPDEDSLATVLEGGVGIGGIVPEGGISIVNLGLLDDDKPIFCRFC